MHIDSDLLRIFVAVTEAGSVSGAGVAVGRTQSAISAQVSKLERLAGQPLFERHARGVRLTAAGEALLPHARRVGRALGEAEAALAPGRLSGVVRFGVPEEYGSALLPRVLARFAERHGDVEVTVDCAPSVELQAAVGSGALDLAVLVIDGGATDGAVLAEDPTVWVASAGHDTVAADPLPLAMFAPDCWWRDWATRSLDRRGRAYRIAYTSRSVAGVQAAVTSGLAVGVLARSTVPDGAVVLGGRDGFEPLPGSAVVLRRADGARSAAVDGMEEAIRAAFGRSIL